jgi:hypothetical protein
MGQTVERKSFKKSIKDYEAWLETQLDEIWKGDLREKHEKMKEDAFVFLRATYWRWAETILDICPDLDGAPQVLGVGDIHLENFGVWRDREGRLVWGVNDFDEAADMPYTVDIVRLATSAVLARPADRMRRKIVCTTILKGYRDGLKAPRPFVLDEEHAWLRALLTVSEDERERFWKKMDELKPKQISELYRKPIESEMPDANAMIEKFAKRSAGTGSLGRPRWVAIAKWHGGRLVREAKAIVPSAWTLVAGRTSRKLAGKAIAAGRYRAPDPWYMVGDTVVVRRLSPNARKVEVENDPNELLDRDMLRAMGHELANIHLGNGKPKDAIKKDLAGRSDDWLYAATETASEFVTGEFERWRG